MSKHTPGQCGCVVDPRARWSIIYCPTHTAAPEMAELYSKLIKHVTDNSGFTSWINDFIDEARVLLARIEGEG